MPLTPSTPFTLSSVPVRDRRQVPTSIKLEPTFVLRTPPSTPPSQQAPAQDPTKPWLDEDFDNMLPVVPQVIPAEFQSACPAFGFNRPFTVADLPGRSGAKAVVINKVNVTTTSPEVDPGANYVDISVDVSTPTDTFQLDIYQVDQVNGNVLIKTYQGVSRFCEGLHVGGQDGIILAGAPLAFEVSNITNGASVSVFIEVH